MPEAIETHSFKKPGGGRGRPAPDSNCELCGIVWTEHPRIPVADRKIAATPKKEKPIRAPKTQPNKAQSNPLPQPVEPKISPAELLEQKRLLEEKKLQDEKEAIARTEKLLAFMRNMWVEDKMKRYPDEGNREYWELKYEEECNADW